MTVEHAQNFYLSNMIQLNERLRNHLQSLSSVDCVLLISCLSSYLMLGT
jgi:hypothetical protein